MTPRARRRLNRLLPARIRVWINRPPGLNDREVLTVGGIERTYWRAPAFAAHDRGHHDRPLPLLIGFHGLFSSGSRLAWWSGLGTRAPCAGFNAVFPDARAQVWDDHGCGHVDGTDDYEFIARLIDRLVERGEADPERVFITGISCGASMSERLARTGVIRLRGAALVSGTTRRAVHDTTEIVPTGTPLLMFAGTQDPRIPYTAGGPSDFLWRQELKHVRRRLADPTGHDSVHPEQLATAWAAANGCPPSPDSEPVHNHPADPSVHRLTWKPAAPDGAPVILYRMDGAGHGWPGGRQYLPVSMIGKIPQHFDATGIVLQFARQAVGAQPRPS